MTYVIAEPCIDVKDRSCVDECPVDCIYEGGRKLYIQPDECVDCGACEPVCPVTAIFYEDDVPPEWKVYTAIDAEFFADNVSGSIAGWRRAVSAVEVTVNAFQASSSRGAAAVPSPFGWPLTATIGSRPDPVASGTSAGQRFPHSPRALCRGVLHDGPRPRRRPAPRSRSARPLGADDRERPAALLLGRPTRCGVAKSGQWLQPGRVRS
jgi:ferredoxin